jgi:hypothetical protein
METMNLIGVAGTKGALCRVSVRSLEALRRGRPGTGGFGADFGAATSNPATDVVFPDVRALG